MSASSAELRVVGIDTATRAGSVAMIRCGDRGAPERMVEVAHEEELRHAETLLPAIDRCLERAGCTLGEVSGYAVSIGPGSFTGLRVGLSTAKGLSFATGAWLVGVPTLEAYAAAAARRGGGPVYVCLDARKGEVYAALFATDGAGRVERLLDDAVETPAAAVERLRPHLVDHDSTLRVVGDGAARYPDEIVAALERERGVEVAPQSPSGRGFAVAELGCERFRAAGPDDTAYLAPRYLRASEAELKLRERRAAARESR